MKLFLIYYDGTVRWYFAIYLWQSTCFLGTFLLHFRITYDSLEGGDILCAFNYNATLFFRCFIGVQRILYFFTIFLKSWFTTKDRTFNTTKMIISMVWDRSTKAISTFCKKINDWYCFDNRTFEAQKSAKKQSFTFSWKKVLIALQYTLLDVFSVVEWFNCLEIISG